MRFDVTVWMTMITMSSSSVVVDGFTAVPKIIRANTQSKNSIIRLYSMDDDDNQIISPFAAAASLGSTATDTDDDDDEDEEDDDEYSYYAIYDEDDEEDGEYYYEDTFDESAPAVAPELAYTATEATELGDDSLELTWENVELVLEEMRPYLIADGGNVAISEIDGPVVRLELQGACGTCPSSTQTMKMGLERKLREKIPEIQEVVQSMPEGPVLGEEQVNVVLDGVRPFLQVAGGSIEISSIEGEGGLQPTVNLKMDGASATLNSVKLEIAQRLQRHFMLSGLRVEWEE